MSKSKHSKLTDTTHSVLLPGWQMSDTDTENMLSELLNTSDAMGRETRLTDAES